MLSRFDTLLICVPRIDAHDDCHLSRKRHFMPRVGFLAITDRATDRPIRSECYGEREANTSHFQGRLRTIQVNTAGETVESR